MFLDSMFNATPQSKIRDCDSSLLLKNFHWRKKFKQTASLRWFTKENFIAWLKEGVDNFTSSKPQASWNAVGITKRNVKLKNSLILNYIEKDFKFLGEQVFWLVKNFLWQWKLRKASSNDFLLRRMNWIIWIWLNLRSIFWRDRCFCMFSYLSIFPWVDAVLLPSWPANVGIETWNKTYLHQDFI